MTEGNFIFTTEKAPVTGIEGGEKLQAVITGLLQERRHVEVPELIGGYPTSHMMYSSISSSVQSSGFSG